MANPPNLQNLQQSLQTFLAGNLSGGFLAGGTPALTQGLKQAEIWPIQLQGKVNRLTDGVLGNPQIEQYYHKSLEEGRKLEKSISDANNLLLEKKLDLEQKIDQLFHMNSLAVDGQLPDQFQIPKYVVDSINILKLVNEYEQDIVGLVSAVTSNIGILSSLAQNTFQMIQANLNAIANLLNNICNWGLPDLPALPNLFADTVWFWNGFNFFPLAAFKPNIKFDYNFAFNMCVIHVPNINIFRNYPSSIPTYGGLTYGTPFFVPPLGGLIPSTGVNLSDPNFIAVMQQTETDPVYLSPDSALSTLPPGCTAQVFNPQSTMWGSVPDPHTPIDNYQMPPATYTSNIVAIAPNLRRNTVLPGAPDYAAPNLAARQPQLRKDLAHYATLGNIVANAYDPLLMSAWLLSLASSRGGWAGDWLAHYQAEYAAQVAPSAGALAVTPVPWNNVLGSVNSFWMGAWDPTVGYLAGDVVAYGGALWQAVGAAANVGQAPAAGSPYWDPAAQTQTYKNAPDIPLTDALRGLSGWPLGNLLWRLSYVEAGLLGYPRDQQWDGYADAAYLATPTGSDLDYVPTALGTQVASLVLGAGSAEFPVPVTFPSAIKNTLNTVIAQATVDIQNDPGYQSANLGNRYTYNQFSLATPVDRFSQFWRDFAANLRLLLAQDPYLVQFAVTYTGTLGGAVNPLADPAPYRALVADVGSRNRAWVPGTPLLPIPVAPNVTFTNPSGATSASGWYDPPTGFDAVAFLARPDVQALGIPTQEAMLRTNITYAAVQQFKSDYIAEVNSQIATALGQVAGVLVGFRVTDYASVTPVPGATAAQPAFDPIRPGTADFDNTSNTSNLPPGTFVIQSAGNYTGAGQINWDPSLFPDQQSPPQSPDGVYTVTVTQNGATIATSTSLLTSSNPALPFSFAGAFAAGDAVAVSVSHNLGTAQSVIPGPSAGLTFFTMQQQTSGGGPTGATAALPATYVADTPYWMADPIPSLTVMRVDAAGHVTPIDVFVPAVQTVQVAGATAAVGVAAHHFSPGDYVLFSGMDSAAFLNGQVAVVQPSTTPTSVVATLQVGSYSYGPAAENTSPPYTAALLRATPDGSLLAPNPDGVSTAQVYDGGLVGLVMMYGGIYSAPNASFATGELIYAGLNGEFTQDYSGLFTASPPAQVGWIVVVGKAISPTEFIYEPHVPTRVTAL